GDDYSPSDSYTFSALYDIRFDHGKLLRMILDTGAKLAYGFAAFRAPQSWDYLDWICQTLKNDIDYLHTYAPNADPDIICGAGVGETINITFTNLPLPPEDVVRMFYPRGR